MEQLSLFDTPVQTVKKAETPKTEKAWLVIDGNNLLNRCYYATAHSPHGLMQAPDGQYTNAVSRFLRMLFKYEEELGACPVVMFDEGKGFRKELYPAYKEGRNETPEPLRNQFPLIKELLKTGNIPVYQSPILEADDLIGAFAEGVDGNVYILSNDKDLYQTVTERVTVITRKGKEDVFVTPERFGDMYAGLVPKQIVDLKAITGDSSDNIPGIDGIGEKGALSLLQHFSTIENMIEAAEFPKALNRYKGKIADQSEKALFAKQLTTLDTNAELDVSPYVLNANSLALRCRELGINTICRLLSNRVENSIVN